MSATEDRLVELIARVRFSALDGDANDWEPKWDWNTALPSVREAWRQTTREMLSGPEIAPLAAELRDAVLEEAAQVCERDSPLYEKDYGQVALDCAITIRKLKTTLPAKKASSNATPR